MDRIRFEYSIRFRFFTKSDTTVVEKTEIADSIRDSFPAYLPFDAAEIAFFIQSIYWAFAKREAHKA